MTGPITLDAGTRGYDALMRTLIGASSTQQTTFGSRVAATIARDMHTPQPATNETKDGA